MKTISVKNRSYTAPGDEFFVVASLVGCTDG